MDTRPYSSPVSLDIHCTGTHTECKNHITNSNEFINDVCPKHFIPSTIISIKPVAAKLSKDKYHVKYGEQDSIITEQELSKNINTKSKYLESLIIRTLPNESDKLIRNYDLNPVAFFSNDAIKYILNLGVKHLLVDLPSIDRGNDHGLLGNHHLFFEKGKTISELLFIPNKYQGIFLCSHNLSIIKRSPHTCLYSKCVSCLCHKFV